MVVFMSKDGSDSVEGSEERIRVMKATDFYGDHIPVNTVLTGDTLEVDGVVGVVYRPDGLNSSRFIVIRRLSEGDQVGYVQYTVGGSAQPQRGVSAVYPRDSKSEEDANQYSHLTGILNGITGIQKRGIAQEVLSLIKRVAALENRLDKDSDN